MAEQAVKNLDEQKDERQARAIARYLRISPRKMRLVIDTIRRQPVEKALARLSLQKKKGARLAEKVLRSAIANAKVLDMDVERLYVADIRADGGPTFKRFMARAMGRADRILKRTTHLSVVLREGKKRWGLPDQSQQQKEEKKDVKGIFKKKKQAAAKT